MQQRNFPRRIFFESKENGKFVRVFNINTFITHINFYRVMYFAFNVDGGCCCCSLYPLENKFDLFEEFFFCCCCVFLLINNIIFKKYIESIFQTNGKQEQEPNEWRKNKNIKKKNTKKIQKNYYFLS